MDPRYYNYAGLRVASQLPLPEWAPFEQATLDGDPHVVISLDEVLTHDPTVREQRVVTASECRFVVPGVGAFRVSGGREIVVAPARGVAPRHLRPWLIGSAWGSLCYQRGLFLIHASAVLVDEQAVLFCAPAKGGKSTLAAQWNARGYALISDDLCHLNIPAQGVPIVYPSAPRLKLWSDALGELGWNTSHLDPDPSRAGKFHVIRTANSHLRPTPVRAIYLLKWGEFCIRPLSGLNALRRFLAAATYRPGLLGSMEQVSQYSSQSMKVLQRVPVWELQRPRELTTMGNTADLLASHWAAHRAGPCIASCIAPGIV